MLGIILCNLLQTTLFSANTISWVAYFIVAIIKMYVFGYLMPTRYVLQVLLRFIGLAALLIGVTVSQGIRDLEHCIEECMAEYRRCMSCPMAKQSLCKANKRLCDDTCMGRYGGGDEDYEDVF